MIIDSDNRLMDIHGPGPYLNTRLPPADLVCPRLVEPQPRHILSLHFLFSIDSPVEL